MAPIDFLWIRRTLIGTALAVCAPVWAQSALAQSALAQSALAQSALAQSAEEKEEGWRKAAPSDNGDFVVEPGSKVPLSLINSVSTKHSVEGDRVYLET